MSWTAIGCGSYRRVAPGTYEMRWRPAGHGGPKRSRRVRWDTAKIRAFLVQQSENRRRLNLGVAVAPCWDDALTAYDARLKARGTEESYRQLAGRILRGIAAAVPDLTAATPMAVSAYFDGRATELQDAECPGWGRTTNKEMRMAYGFFRWATKTHLLQWNVMDALDAYPERKPARRRITPAEYAKVWAVSEDSIRDLMDWQLITAVRISEIADMTWADVDRKAGRWLIPKRKGRDTLEHQLNDVLLQILLRQPRAAGVDRVFRRWVAPNPDPGGRPVKGHGFVAGVPIRKEWWNNVLEWRCRRAGVNVFTSHSLRRAAANWARDSGVEIGDIQLLLGHSTVTTTEIYAPGSDVGRERAMEAVARIREEALRKATS